MSQIIRFRPLCSACFPRSTPLCTSRIAIHAHAEVEYRTKDSIGKGYRGQPAWLKCRVSPMRLKFVYKVPQSVKGIPNDQGDGQTHTDQSYHDKRHDHGNFQSPCRRHSEVRRKSEIECRDHDEKHRVEALL